MCTYGRKLAQAWPLPGALFSNTFGSDSCTFANCTSEAPWGSAIRHTHARALIQPCSLHLAINPLHSQIRAIKSCICVLPHKLYYLHKRRTIVRSGGWGCIWGLSLSPPCDARSIHQCPHPSMIRATTEKLPNTHRTRTHERPDSTIPSQAENKVVRSGGWGCCWGLSPSLSLSPKHTNSRVTTGCVRVCVCVYVASVCVCIAGERQTRRQAHLTHCVP